jgi:hypothetical protein
MIPWRIGQGFRSAGCPCDIGPHILYRLEPLAHKAAGFDRSYRQYGTPGPGFHGQMRQNLTVARVAPPGIQSEAPIARWALWSLGAPETQGLPAAFLTHWEGIAAAATARL